MTLFAHKPTPKEILVERVKFMRFAEAQGRFDETMTQVNAFAAKAREAKVERGETWVLTCQAGLPGQAWSSPAMTNVDSAQRPLGKQRYCDPSNPAALITG
jgi:hypothetical protein